MMNHGGSPPNLGLKETTPGPGETRLNKDKFKQHHSKKNQNEYHYLTTHLQSQTKAHRMIPRWNHKHWVKVGSTRRRRMPYPCETTNLGVSIFQ